MLRILPLVLWSLSLRCSVYITMAHVAELVLDVLRAAMFTRMLMQTRYVLANAATPSRQLIGVCRCAECLVNTFV